MFATHCLFCCSIALSLCLCSPPPQSIIPGILYGDRTTQMLYGSVDTGKTIKWSEQFHEKVKKGGMHINLQ